MFEEFYEMYEPEEQEVVALINRCIGGGYKMCIRDRYQQYLEAEFADDPEERVARAAEGKPAVIPDWDGPLFCYASDRVDVYKRQALRVTSCHKFGSEITGNNI